MVVELSTSDIANPEVNRVLFAGPVALFSDGKGTEVIVGESITCTGIAIFDFVGNDDIRRDILEFPISDDLGNAITLGERTFIHATATGSLASIHGGEGTWAVDSVDTFIREFPPGSGNQAIWVRAALAASDGLHVNRMAYQVDILLGPLASETITLTSLTLNPTRVRRGDPSLGTVTLSGPAPASGALISLFSGNPTIAVVPAFVTVPAGQTTATFPASTQPVAESPSQVDRPVDITASFGGVSLTATLTVIGEIF